MKLSKIALACLVATTGMTAAGFANAEVDENFEFHGSFRAGYLTSDADEYDRNEWAGGTKEMLGRLGMEADNDFSVDLAKKWVFDDGKSVKVAVSVGEMEEDDYSASDFPGAYIEYEGIADTGVLWGGKRDYLKGDNYIFMTDFFLRRLFWLLASGLSNYEIGDAKVSIGYTASDRAEDEDSKLTRDDETNKTMHLLHLGIEYGKFKVDMAAKSMPDNQSYWGALTWEGDSAGDTLNSYAETGFDISVTYSMDTFFGVDGNGFSKIIAQAGEGLGAQQLLGGALTSYNAYRPGTVMKGGSNGPAVMANNYKEDTSARLLLWGGYFLENGINIFPSIQGQYNDHYYEETYDYWWSTMVRATFPTSYDNFYVQSEAGYAYKNWDGSTWFEKKLTIAPTFVMGTGSGPAPEIRFLASYLPEADLDGDGEDGEVVFGIQADAWW